MGLKHLKLATDTVEFAGGEFSVRGLNSEDITAIVRLNAAPLSLLFVQLQQRETQISLSDSVALASSLATAAPQVVGQIIAVASRVDPAEEDPSVFVDPEDLAIARLLPFPVQIEALEKIGKLTFEAEGGPKKVLETIIRVANGVSATIADLRS